MGFTLSFVWPGLGKQQNIIPKMLILALLTI